MSLPPRLAQLHEPYTVPCEWRGAAVIVNHHRGTGWSLEKTWEGRTAGKAPQQDSLEAGNGHTYRSCIIFLAEVISTISDKRDNAAVSGFLAEKGRVAQVRYPGIPAARRDYS
ncbi:hypothetical protein E2C01_018964 [Portunus trituberculatus]|uniref:Uncharacterized protein n=1 Tax=Portunus trituberculatus TaxID=210409 RepID=A0A5B7DWF4_PORTR|nr:hypothetical protein [Portunus trituberculatus]